MKETVGAESFGVYWEESNTMKSMKKVYLLWLV